MDYNIEIKPKYFIHGILDDLNGLRVYLCDFYGDSSITILFSGFVYHHQGDSLHLIIIYQPPVSRIIDIEALQIQMLVILQLPDDR